MNNPTQNQGMTHYEMVNLKKELQTLRESLTNLTTKLPIELDPKKNPQPQTTKA